LSSDTSNTKCLNFTPRKNTREIYSKLPAIKNNLKDEQKDLYPKSKILRKNPNTQTQITRKQIPKKLYADCLCCVQAHYQKSSEPDHYNRK